MGEEYITMSYREMDRLELLQALMGKQLRQREVAERPSLSVRQVKRVAARYEPKVCGWRSGARQPVSINDGPYALISVNWYRSTARPTTGSRSVAPAVPLSSS